MATVISSSYDGTRLAFVSNPDSCYRVGIWDLKQDAVISSREIENMMIPRVAQWCPDNIQIAFGTASGAIFIWKSDSDELTELRADNGIDPYNECTSLFYSPTGKFLIAGYADASIRVWDINAQRVSRVISGHSHGYRGPAITSVAWSPDGDTLALFSAAEGTPWKASQKTTSVIPGLSRLGPYLQIEIAGPNEEAAKKLGHNIYLWSFKSNRLAMKIPREAPWAVLLTLALLRINRQLAAKVPRNSSWGGWIYGLAFSPDGKYIAAADGVGIGLWRLWRHFRKAKQVHKVEFDGYSKRSLLFSPDSRFLATGNENSVCVLDLHCNLAKKQFEPAGGWWRGSSLGFLRSDNQHILAAEWLDSFILWDCLSGKQIKEVKLTKAS